MFDGLRVVPGEAPDLAHRPSRDSDEVEDDKSVASRLLPELQAEISRYQQRLFAEERRSVLLVLQGTDTSGKDGTIRRVLQGVSPSGMRVTAFKAPSTSELAHDYLWRVHAACPLRGEIGVFNRSHYEDVVAVRVRGLADDATVFRRYGHLREFERLLHDEGTRVLKCFLHLSADTQKERLQARLDDPEKRWKFRRSDLEDRKRWDDFLAAYEDALRQTSTPWAPWYVVPADRKWQRNLVVAQLLLSVLREMDPQVPPGDDGGGVILP
ncbi:polyphosphate kinase 2 family protein [soil metagenome]